MATATVSPRGSAIRHPSKYSHPPPWQDSNESSSMCNSTKNFFCVTLRLRVLGYIIQQPPSFLFVASLLIIATVIPFIGVYIENAPRLPDTDKMKEWNAFLGRLPNTRLCLTEYNSSTHTSLDIDSIDSVCVRLPFLVKLDSKDATAYNGTTLGLSGVLSGTTLKTKITDPYSGGRIDEDVMVSLFLNTPEIRSSEEPYMVNASVIISVPHNATSYFGSFSDLDPTEVELPCDHTPSVLNSQRLLSLAVVGDSQCKSSSTSTVWPAPEQYRHRGLIVVYLTKDEQNIGASRLKLSTIVVIGVVISFVIGIGCTDRPAKPKPSQS